MTVNPTARALAALTAIQDHPGITAEQLGRRLEVTDRAARRYVATLRAAGVPIESTTGKYGGYRLGRGQRTPLVFRTEEALSLVMAVLDGQHEAGADTPVGRALGKLLGALPEQVAAQAQAVRRRAAAAPDHVAARPDPTITAELVRASDAGRRVRVDYRSESGKEWTAEIDPWAVVVRYGRWYLLGHVHRSGEKQVDATRTYRVDRIGRVRLTDETFTPPEDLDPAEALGTHLGTGWEHECRVWIDTSPEHARRHLSPVMGTLVEQDGGALLTGSTNEPHWYAAALAALPHDYLVLGDAALVAAVERVATRMSQSLPAG